MPSAYKLGRCWLFDCMPSMLSGFWKKKNDYLMKFKLSRLKILSGLIFFSKRIYTSTNIQSLRTSRVPPKNSKKSLEDNTIIQITSFFFCKNYHLPYLTKKSKILFQKFPVLKVNKCNCCRRDSISPYIFCKLRN